VRFRPEVIACGCIYMAAHVLKIPLPEQPNAWWELFDAKKEQLDEIAWTINQLYKELEAKYVSLYRSAPLINKRHDERHNERQDEKHDEKKSPKARAKKSHSHSPSRSSRSSRSRSRSGSHSPSSSPTGSSKSSERKGLDVPVEVIGGSPLEKAVSPGKLKTSQTLTKAPKQQKEEKTTTTDRRPPPPTLTKEEKGSAPERRPSHTVKDEKDKRPPKDEKGGIESRSDSFSGNGNSEIPSLSRQRSSRTIIQQAPDPARQGPKRRSRQHAKHSQPYPHHTKKKKKTQKILSHNI